ncbi:MAG TPA: ribonucleoside reductase class II [Candidatus Aenigmarchaeota archaeon]|nr:MAG: ribonucleoside reductase class II [Candidatus Aenigmarchaeota archaeon]HDD46095.1 ribonucleoside reductase class II [Candidatus Aenigmarchaeota archaeon]
MAVRRIIKRDGRVVKFEKEKIANAIWKAAQAVGGKDYELAKRLADEVVAIVNEKFKKTIPSVEDVQDIVEKVLIERGHAKTAKAYILYRQEHKKIREVKSILGVKDDLKLPINTIKVLKSRYLLKDEKGNVIETTSQLFRRVARHIALVDILYDPLVFDINKEQEVKDMPDENDIPQEMLDIGLNKYNLKMLYRAYKRLNLKRYMKVSFNELLEIIRMKYKSKIKKTEERFYRLMTNFLFMPNSPTLMNAGAPLGQLSACFVLPIDDSIPSIFDALKYTAIIHQTGGGTGFSFSKLRPNGDIVRSTRGVASGPVSFMRVFDVATDVIKQGGKRRGANMGILRIDHPDILDFITSKDTENMLFSNFNISVAITDKFMEALEKDEEFELINPRTKQAVKRLYARQLWEMIIYQAWKTGDPGVIFIDEINRHNPTPHIGMIESTNPCVTGDMLVSTEYGLLRMDELADGHHTALVVDRRVIGDSDVDISPMLKAWRTGVKETYKLVTKSGYELVATPDHKIMTPNGWVPLLQLKPGKDKVLIQSAPGIWNTNKKIPFDNSFQKEWSKELGHVLGWLIGDGWLRDSDKNRRVGFSFGKNDRDILCYLKPILNRMYGREIKEIIRENGTYHLSYHGKSFVEFFRKLGVKPVKAGEKEVPVAIFTATRDAVVGFLQALFAADGTVAVDEKKDNIYVRLTSKSLRLLKQVQLLLLNCGIKSRVYNRSRKRAGKFRYVDKHGKEKVYESNGILYELQINKESLQRFLNEIGFLCNKYKDKIKKINGHRFYKDVFEDEVAEIIPNGKEVVYDLTEPLTHSFICNGIIVSNCGEQPLLPYESCNLGSINLSKFVENKGDKAYIDWNKLEETVKQAVHFLDNVIDANAYPIPQIEFMTLANRKIGLGVMGWAEMLIKLGIKYDSEEAVKLAERVMKFVQEKAREKSVEMAKARGNFPNFKGSVWEKKGYKYMRNATQTTIAPTGTISIIANTTSGIEPLFAVVFVRRNILGGEEELVEINPLFEKISKERGFYSEELMRKISETGSLRGIEGIPKDVREIFVTAHDIDPEWHVRMQAAFQKYTDNAVSKTINLRHNATINDVDKAYRLAYKLKCKGITIYRDRSKSVQVIHIGQKEKHAEISNNHKERESKLKESEEKCPVCRSKLYYAEGCYTCLACGFSKCG